MQQQWILEAIRLAREGLEKNLGGPFGAVVVFNGQIVGRGQNMVTSTNDPTAHAEVVAIRDACKRLGRFDLRGCEIYASCEPCPMCLASIYWARLDKVFYACTRADAADIGFDDAFIYSQIALDNPARSLPMEQCNREDAIVVFRAWQDKPDATRY
ncbi:MAG: nucleoside deaminase [Verrucomicrobiota bacterium]|nr:nucleoside deaminase [Verrucomicrobiota bacterium]